MSLYDQARAFARRYPVHPDTQPTAGWNMNCALLMARFAVAPGGVGWAALPRGYGNAIQVALNSGYINPDRSQAAPGDWHVWDWGIYGHIGSDLTGGGEDVFMASAFLRDAWGTHIGVNSVAGYNAANKTAKYLGVITNYRGGRYNLSSFAGGHEHPLDTPPAAFLPKEKDMFFIVACKSNSYRNGIWLVGPGFVNGFTPANWAVLGQDLQTTGMWVLTAPSDQYFDELIQLCTNQRYGLNRGDNNLLGDAGVDAFITQLVAKLPDVTASPLGELTLTGTISGKVTPE